VVIRRNRLDEVVATRSFRGAWAHLRAGMNDAFAPNWSRGRLLRAEREAERVFEMSPALLAVAGFDGYLKRFNPAFEAFGYSREELLSRPWFEFAHPNDRERMLQAAASLERGADVVKLENRIVCSDGSLRWVEWSTRVVPEEGLFYAAGRDVTQSRLANNELNALRRVATLVAEGEAPRKLFAVVAEEVAGVVDVPVVRVVRYELDGTATECAGFSREGPVFPIGRRWSLEGTNVLRLVRETSAAARIDDYAGLEGELADMVRRAGLRSTVAIPIAVTGRLWGAMVVSSPERLSDSTEARLADFSELIATAIANAESREVLKLLADEQAALRRVATLVAKGASQGAVLDAMAGEMQALLDADQVALNRFEPGAEIVVLAHRGLDVNRTPVGSRVSHEGENVTSIVRRTGSPARMENYAEAGGALAALARVTGLRSSVSAPITVEGEVWGVVTASWKGDESPPADTEDRMVKFAQLLETAIANTEARGEVTRLAEEQSALGRVATLVAQEASQAQVFEAIAGEAMQLLRTDAVRIIRYDGESGVVLAGSGQPEVTPPGFRFLLDGETVAARIFQQAKPARHDEYKELSGPVAELVRAAGIRSVVGAPVLVEGRLWGAITAGMTREEPLPPETESRLGAFTALMGTAISNAEARAEVERLAEEQAALRRVATLVARESSPMEVFGAVTEEAWRALDTEAVGMLRFESDGTATLVAQSYTPWDPPPLGTRFTLEGENIIAQVLRTGQAVRVDDWADATGQVAAMASALGIRSSVATPIVVEGRLWGTMVAVTSQSEPLPDNTGFRIGQFTELVATAIANAEARAEVERLADEQAALRRVATLVARGEPPAEIFTAVSREVERVFTMDETFDLATVVRFDPGPEFVLVGAAKSFEGLPIGSRWPSKDLYVSTRIARTGRSARVSEGDLVEVGGADAETLRRQGIISQVGSPIIVEGRLWGAITMNTKEALPPDTEERLEKFTELVATAMANAESKSELAASRRRIVAASDEARRRIERDLHDGIQQRLVSLGLAVRAAEANVPSDWSDLREELSRVATGLSDTVEGVQELSRGIHPAILSHGGLAPALRMLARRSAVPVELNLTTSDRFREPVEVAAYFVASEALTNATKYSQASQIQISLAARERTLELSIRDDGVGGADPARGSGLVGLADRVEALGGSIRVSSHAGQGTQITAELPLEQDSVEQFEPSALPLAAIANVADALYVVDGQGRIRFLNPAAVRILGYDHEKQLLGRSSHETIHYMHPDGTAFPAEECPLLLPRVTGEEVHVDEDWFVRKDRTFVRVAYSSAAIPLPGGRGAVVSFRDLPPKDD
jgi:PAS domain S-box-containing protein